VNCQLLTTRFLTFLSVCALSFASTFAQSATATLSGTVIDQNGAVVPGANITVTNTATGLSRKAITNEQGSFSIPLLPPSTYTIGAEREGFAPLRVDNVVLNVGDQKALRIELKTGDVKAEVQVTSDAPLINESPAVGTIVDRQFVGNLPLNGRSFNALIELTPGTVLTAGVPGGLEKGGFSINGQRANANYFMVDGVSANIDAASGGAAGQSDAGSVPPGTALGGFNNLISVDALQEFKIQTSTYAPEFGRQPGGQISIATRSGTNKFHGTLFNYFRNDALDANNWFANRAGLPKPPLRQNDFGGVFGGPIFKNRTFFFFSYEGLRLRQPVTAIKEVPPLASRQAAVAGMRPFLNAFPLPNGPDTASGFAQFSASFSNPASLDATSFRADHAVGPNLTLFARYNYAPSETTARGVFANTSLNTLTSIPRKTQTLTGGATWSIDAATTNDLRLNWSKTAASVFLRLDDFGGAVPPPDSLLFPPSVSSGEGLFGLFILPGANYAVGKNNDNLQRQVNVVDNFSFTKGTHQMKFGLDWRQLAPTLSTSAYSIFPSFSSMAVAVRGQADIGVSIFAKSGDGNPGFTNLSLYAQDTWKVTQRLTLTYGLRWELNPPPKSRDGKPAATVLGLDDPATMTLAPLGTPLWKTTYNNFAPRLGLAYQLSQAQGRETVVRGGFGVFYDLGNTQAARGFANIAFPYITSKFLANVTFPLDAATAAPLPFSLSPPFGEIWPIDPHLKLPYTLQWNFSLEQSVGSTQTLSASYVAAVGRRLLRLERLLNPNPDFTSVIITRNANTSDYHALQLQFMRRLSRGLQALASYTWSHSIDTDSSDGSFFNSPFAILTPQRERGPSDFDVRHTVTGAITYDFPTPQIGSAVRAVLGNWSVDTIFRARTATPVNVITGAVVVGTFGGSLSVSRPDVITGVPLYVADSSVAGTRRINRAAFDAASPVGAKRQGTLGRNRLRGFGASQVDFTLRRQFNLTERINLQFRAEFFNIFNHPNFANPVNVLTSGLFGQSTAMLAQGLLGGGLSPLYQIGGPRSIQLGLKLQF